MPSWPADIAEERFAAARVGRLATVTALGRPHIVPVCFVLHDGRVYTAVDEKPKATSALARLENVRATRRASLLVDHYDEDWSALWWVRADGAGRVLEPGEPAARDAVALLCDRYAQYAERPPAGPVLAVGVTRWSGWSATRGG